MKTTTRRESGVAPKAKKLALKKDTLKDLAATKKTTRDVRGGRYDAAGRSSSATSGTV